MESVMAMSTALTSVSSATRSEHSLAVLKVEASAAVSDVELDHRSDIWLGTASAAVSGAGLGKSQLHFALLHP